MQAEGKTIALARGAPSPPPKGVVVREEGVSEPLGPTVYRRVVPQSTKTLVAEWRWSALSPAYMLPGLGLSCAILWAGLYHAPPYGLLFWLWALLPALLTYYAIAIALNRTVLRVNDDALVIQHGPLPWPGRRLATDDLRRLICRPERRWKGDENDAHELWALLHDGSQRPLAHALTPDGARFLERLVETHLADLRAEGDETRKSVSR